MNEPLSKQAGHWCVELYTSIRVPNLQQVASSLLVVLAFHPLHYCHLIGLYYQVKYFL